jgi:phytoene dehydrogenase-like protein
MTRRYDIVVVGAGADGLVAATVLARGGSKVLLLEAQPEPGGTLQEFEFAPGYRAAPLAQDLGYLAPEVLQATGLALPAAVAEPAPVVALGDGEPLALHRSIEDTVAGLRRLAPRDAAAWPGFAASFARWSGFLGQVYRQPCPTLDPATLGEYLSLLRLGRGYRALGREDMTGLLRALPMSVADLLDDHFESPRLKGVLAGLAVTDLCQGPLSGGTTMALLHRHVGAPVGSFGGRLQLAAGPIALVAGLVQAAEAAGVTMETGSTVQSWLVEGERVAGVRLASGEEVHAGRTLSSLDPRTSLLEMLDPAWLGPERVMAISNIRYRGVTSYLLCALEGLPELPGLDPGSGGALWIAPSIRGIEQAYDAAKHGDCSAEPVVEIRFPSLRQPSLAPPGGQVAVLRVQYTPWRLREGSWSQQRDALTERVMARVERELPGFVARVRARELLTPADLESRWGLREGALSRGETLLDQMLFMRPVPGLARHATPMPGLWLCGAGCYPGPGLTGLSGLHAARAMLGR